MLQETGTTGAAYPAQNHDRIVKETRRFKFRFPNVEDAPEQDKEWCDVLIDGEWTKLRFHDYDRIYSVPGLYEDLFYKTLKCKSPRRVVQLLCDVLRENAENSEDLRIIDVGAGNGHVAERLCEVDVDQIVGVDIIPEAKEAALRDRPRAYNDYLVADLTRLTPEQVERLEAADFNALVSVAALGFGDIPPRAFANAFNFVHDGGWIAFNVKEEFLSGEKQSGFDRLIKSMIAKGHVELHAYLRYLHRENVTGEKLYYVALIYRKTGSIPESLVRESEAELD
jgi:SAM-dependent methyltransferase